MEELAPNEKAFFDKVVRLYKSHHASRDAVYQSGRESGIEEQRLLELAKEAFIASTAVPERQKR